MSHPTRGAWIEMDLRPNSCVPNTSHPTRGAWIEISISFLIASNTGVAPHPGCVD